MSSGQVVICPRCSRPANLQMIDAVNKYIDDMIFMLRSYMRTQPVCIKISYSDSKQGETGKARCHP